MRPSELSYIVTEKEQLAIVWSLQKLNTYLRSAKIFVKTDHQALIILQRCKFATGRIRRWMLLIQEFDIEIEHIKGKDNIVPDILTRHPSHMPNIREKPGEIIMAVIIRKKLDEEVVRVLKNLSHHQEEDEHLMKIRNTVAGEDPEAAEEESKTCVMKKNVLYKKNMSGKYVIMLPNEFARKFILAVHETYDNVGVKKFKKLIQKGFYIKNLRHQTALLVSTCDTCQRNKPSTRPAKAPL